jgi:hypothetical protein
MTGNVPSCFEKIRRPKTAICSILSISQFIIPDNLGALPVLILQNPAGFVNMLGTAYTKIAKPIWPDEVIVSESVTRMVGWMRVYS